MIEKIVKRCLHQVIQSKDKVYVPLDNRGDCYKCVYDEKNKKCNGYTPVTFNFYEVNHKV